MTAISPTLQGTALVRSGGIDRSVQIKGVFLDEADLIYEISDRMVTGNPLIEGNTAVIGSTLAQDMGLESGDNFNLLLPNGGTVRLLVGGAFDLQ